MWPSTRVKYVTTLRFLTIVVFAVASAEVRAQDAPAEPATAAPPTEPAPAPAEASAQTEASVQAEASAQTEASAQADAEPASAQGEAITEVDAEIGVPPDKPGKKPKLSMVEKRAIATTPVGIFGVKGRVFANLELRHRADQLIVDRDGMINRVDVDSLDVTLDSARFSLLYQNPAKWLIAEIEVEVSDPDQVELRDAYLLAEGGPFSFKAGNFKVPTSAIELESAWTLPSSRRGFINELLLDYLDVAERRPGLQAVYRGPGPLDPTLIVGMFQGSVLIEHVGDDRDTELIEEANLDSQSWVARAQIELAKKVDIGVFFEQRVGSPMPLQTQHYPVLGADAVFDDEFGDFGLRVWADVHYGESWYAHSGKPAGEEAPWFLAARAILAFRYGGTKDGLFYVEPFGSLQMLDPDLDVDADAATEFTAGVNVGFWDEVRVTLEGFTNDTSRNFPESYFGGPWTPTMGLTLQFGAAF